MGTSVNAQDNSESQYVNSVTAMSHIASQRSFSILKMLDIFYVFSNTYRSELKALDVLHSYSKGVIQKKKEKATIGDTLLDEFGVKKRRAFLDLLLYVAKESGEITDEEIEEEVDTFMFAVYKC